MGQFDGQLAHPADGIYLGLMSGTSMDGVDGVAVQFTAGQPPRVLAEAFVALDGALRDALFALQYPGADEIAREALAANTLAVRYAACCQSLLDTARLVPEQVRAAGVHGQTVRHRPDQGYTRQINNAALLAELIQIDVIADFRSRDVASGGQGAPLVPAFHASVFGARDEARVICNLGGISNLTILFANQQEVSESVVARGFDCGPANVLLDGWMLRHLGKPFDEGGEFAAQGNTDPALLDLLLAEPFFSLPPPKSTGRDQFNLGWLDAKLQACTPIRPENVQATLVTLTAMTVAREIARHAPGCQAVYVCGGGACNPVLLKALMAALTACGVAATVLTTAALGLPPQQVEAVAFAWLARRFIAREPGNLPVVTGAAGARVLGALYPR